MILAIIHEQQKQTCLLVTIAIRSTEPVYTFDPFTNGGN